MSSQRPPNGHPGGEPASPIFLTVKNFDFTDYPKSVPTLVEGFVSKVQVKGEILGSTDDAPGGPAVTAVFHLPGQVIAFLTATPEAARDLANQILAELDRL